MTIWKIRDNAVRFFDGKLTSEDVFPFRSCLVILKKEISRFGFLSGRGALLDFADQHIFITFAVQTLVQ